MHTTTQKLGRVQAVPRLCGFYPGICLTTEEKAWKNLNQYAKRMRRIIWRCVTRLAVKYFPTLFIN
jgi:hypothetical protein